MTPLIASTMGAIAACAVTLPSLRRARQRVSGLRALLRACEVGDADRAFTDWARHMSVTVVTHTGSVFSATLPELHESEASTFRSWNVPIQISLWSDLDDDAAKRVPAPDPDGVRG